MRNIISKLIALIVIPCILIPSFLFVHAEEDQYAGTPTEGFSTGGKYKIAGYDALSEFTNGDFSEGLKNWTSSTGNYASEFATVKSEDGKTYATVTSENYSGIVSRPFRIKGAEVGDVLAVMADYRGDSKIQLCLEYPNSSVSGTAKGSATVYQSTAENGWNTAVSQSKLTLGAYNKDEAAVKKYGDDYYFYLRIQSQSEPIETDVTNVRIVKVLQDGSYETVDGEAVVFYDEDGDVFDPNAGTSKTGFSTGSKNAIAGWSALSAFTNGDFSKGLKNWTSSTGNYASEFATAKLEGVTTYATITSENYSGIVSRPFRIEGVKEGDVLAVMADYRGDSKLQLCIEHANYVKGASTRSNGSATVYQSTAENGWNTAVSQTKLTLGAYNKDEAAVKKYGDDYYFYIRIQSQKDLITADVTNIRIVKVLEDGTYETVDGEAVVFYDQDGDVFDPNAGTSKTGFSTGSKNAIAGWSALSAFTNGDFSKGLKNWTSSTGNYASEFATAKSENGKTYATITAENYSGIVSRPFRIKGIKEGDVLAVLVDYRGDSKLQLCLEHANYIKGASTRSNGSSTVYIAPDENGWNTAVSQTKLTLGAYNKDEAAVKKYGDDYYFYLRIQSQSDPITTDVTNVRIVKVFEDGTYEDIDGNKIVFYDEDGDIYDPTSGSRKYGIITGKNRAIYGWKCLDEFKNGSFKLGFKHWATVTGVSPTEYASLGMDEDGTAYVTLDCENYQGLCSQPFRIANAKEGDQLVVMVDFRGDLNLQLGLEVSNTVETARAIGMKVIYESGTGWSTAVTASQLTLGAIKTDPQTVAKYGDTYYFTVRVSAASGATLTDVTNVRVLKMQSDGTYVNLDGTSADYKIGTDGSGEVILPILDSVSSKLTIEKLSLNTDVAKQVDVITVVIICLAAVLTVAVVIGTILFINMLKKRRASGGKI